MWHEMRCVNGQPGVPPHRQAIDMKVRSRLRVPVPVAVGRRTVRQTNPGGQRAARCLCWMLRPKRTFWGAARCMNSISGFRIHTPVPVGHSPVFRLGAEGPSLRKRTVAVLHAMLWAGLATAGWSLLKEGLQTEFDVAHAYQEFDGALAQSVGQREDIGAAGIARKVISSVRPPV